MSKVKITTCESGDWIVINVLNDKGEEKVWSGHSMSISDYISIMQFCKIYVSSCIVSDEEMECMSDIGNTFTR